MKTRIKLKVAEGGYALTLTPAQLDTFRWVVAFMQHVQAPDICLRLQVGQTREGLAELSAKLTAAEAGAPLRCGMDDLHTLHAALVVSWNQVLSEEAFYRRIGVFRENVIALAQGLVTAIAEAES
ncbi:hypothetical protein [Streptomyces sp. ISL-11]|uniref:hypothetical protein n=1 Tax=Streptomyces sp. ISL-11 TaxID=2819174 RepID=UPI001BE9E279|nr:hypothetical protein [Streptomyces sp. ISL-11]MBT2385619.1 hypothetical protein [Streptomyces sp. ISL-11]